MIKPYGLRRVQRTHRSFSNDSPHPFQTHSVANQSGFTFQFKNVPEVVVEVVLRALRVARGKALVTPKIIQVRRRQRLIITLIERATAFIQTVPLHVKPHILPLIRIGKLKPAGDFLGRVLPDLVGVGDGLDVHGRQHCREEDREEEEGEGGKEAGHGWKEEQCCGVWVWRGWRRGVRRGRVEWAWGEGEEKKAQACATLSGRQEAVQHGMTRTSFCCLSLVCAGRGGTMMMIVGLEEAGLSGRGVSTKRERRTTALSQNCAGVGLVLSETVSNARQKAC